MPRRFFDYDDCDYVRRISENMAIDSDGNMMMRIADNSALDCDSGEIHFISSWEDDDNDSFWERSSNTCGWDDDD